MKRLSELLLILVLVLFAACREEEPVDSDTGANFKEEAVEEIGPAGGILEAKDFKLIVPAGAFNTSAELKLTSSSENKPFGENGVTKLYRIEGIPDEYGNDLEIKIRYEGTLTEESYIALGENTFVPSLGGNEYTYHLIGAVENDGYYTCHIPAMEGNGTTKSTNIDRLVQSVVVQLITGYAGPHKTNEGNFLIDYPIYGVAKSNIIKLGEYLESAFLLYKDLLGFSYEHRTKYPIKVNVKSLGEGIFGYCAPSHFGDDYSHLEFSSSGIGDLEQIRVSAGHEFMHFVQYLYDPRTRFQKGSYMPAHHWLNEAVAVWTETYFTDDDNYLSAAIDGNDHRPFSGFHFNDAGLSDDDKTTEVSAHGYGMSAVIKYLVDKNGTDIIKKFYKRIIDQKTKPDGFTENPVTTIASCTENPDIWIEDFYRNYILGNIYNIPYQNFTTCKSFQVQNKDDTVMVFSKSYQDLSAERYKVETIYKDFEDNTFISFTASSPNAFLTIFKYRTVGERPNTQFQIENLTFGLKSLKVQNFDKLTDDGYRLLALVTLPQGTPPYTNKTDIDLKIKINIPPPTMDFNRCRVIVQVVGHYSKTSKEESREYDLDTYFEQWDVYPGNFVGNRFTGEYPTGNFKGSSVIVSLNEDHTLVDSITWIEKQDAGNVKSVITFKGKNIPIMSTGYYYKITGESICAENIVTLEYEHNYFGFGGDIEKTKLTNKTCNDESFIFISFSKTDDGN